MPAALVHVSLGLAACPSSQESRRAVKQSKKGFLLLDISLLRARPWGDPFFTDVPFYYERMAWKDVCIGVWSTSQPLPVSSEGPGTTTAGCHGLMCPFHQLSSQTRRERNPGGKVSIQIGASFSGKRRENCFSSHAFKILDFSLPSLPLPKQCQKSQSVPLLRGWVSSLSHTFLDWRVFLAPFLFGSWVSLLREKGTWVG